MVRNPKKKPPARPAPPSPLPPLRKKKKRRKAIGSDVVPVAAKSTTAIAIVAPQTQQRAADVHDLLRLFFSQRSELTVENYRVDLEHFTRWMTAKAKGIDFAAIRREKVPAAAIEQTLVALLSMTSVRACGAISTYVQDLADGSLGQVYSSQTINHRLAAIKSFAKLSRSLGLSDVDLSSVRSKKKSRKRSTAGCGEDGVMSLLACTERRLARAGNRRQRYYAARDRLVLVLLYYSGLRRFEGLACRWPDDVDLKDPRLRFRGKKRDEAEWFEVTERVAEEIRAYLTHRGNEKGLLLPGRDPKKPLDRSAVNRIISSIAEEAGVDVTPHGLRHTAATVMLERSGGNVRAVKEFLRHADLRHVQDYDDERQRLARQMGELLVAKQPQADLLNSEKRPRRKET